MRAETLTLLHEMATDADTLRAMGAKEGLGGLQEVRSLALGQRSRPALCAPPHCNTHALHSSRY
jgi:hypothetical protein